MSHFQFKVNPDFEKAIYRYLSVRLGLRSGGRILNCQMSLDDFQNHLHNATKELIIKNNLPLDKSVVYKIELDLEENKKHNSMDEKR